VTAALARAALLAAALAAELGPGPPAAPRAHPLSVLARADRTEVRLGEPFGYAVEIRHPADEWYALPGELDAPPFRAGRAVCRRAVQREEALTTCALRVQLFELGARDLPDLRFLVQGPEGEATVAVPGARVTGVGLADPAVAPEALRLRGPAPPVPLLVPTLRPVLWALAAAAALLAALVLPRAWRARRRAGAELPPAPAPEVRFARRLDALLARGLPERGLAREFFFELSAILRELLAAATGVPALDLTTAELLERLERAGDPRVDLAALRRFAERADLVKYARAGAAPVECAAAVTYARELVRRITASISTPTSSGPFTLSVAPPQAARSRRATPARGRS